MYVQRCNSTSRANVQMRAPGALLSQSRRCGGKCAIARISAVKSSLCEVFIASGRFSALKLSLCGLFSATLQ